MANERRIRLGELLLRAGLITELQLSAALAEQKKWGGRLGHVLVEMNFISEEILVKGLARLLGVPRAELDGLQVAPALLERFEPTDCQNRAYLPTAYNPQKKELTVALADINDLKLIDDLRYKHGCVVVPTIAGERALQAAIRRVFWGEEFQEDASPSEPSLKMVNNSGSTLVKNRRDIMTPQEDADLRRSTGVERPQPPPAAAPAPAPVAAAARASLDPAQLQEIETSQRRQSRAVKTLVELLIEKGIFSREEFMAAVNRRSE